jgi:hypothetical protein
VFVCIHPNEPYHLDILREVCERYVFVQQGRLTLAPDWDTLLAFPVVRSYLGELAGGSV